MKDEALCPHCGDAYALQDIAPGDQIQERRLEPHADLGAVELGYRPLIGTCQGSHLIESETGREARIEVLRARQRAAIPEARVETIRLIPTREEFERRRAAQQG